MTYLCERCGYQNNRQDMLIRHLKRIKPCNPYLKDISLSELFNKIKKPNEDFNNKYYCEYCNKEYNSRASKYRHQIECKNNKSNLETTNDNIKMDLLKKEIELLNAKLQIKELENKLNNSVLIPNKQNEITTYINDKSLINELNKETKDNNIVSVSKQIISEPNKQNNITLSIDSNKNNNITNSNNIINNNITNNNTNHNNTNNIIAINNDLTNIREYLESNNNILPYSKFDVSLLYDNDGIGLKDLIESDMEYSFKNHNDFLNYAMKKICFNCHTPRNINMYYDDNINKVVVKVGDGVTSNYNLNEIFNDFINQLKNIINKASKYHYEKNNIQISDSSYIDIKLKKYDNENSENIIFFLDLVCENNLKFRDLHKFEFNINNKTVKEETKLKRPIDLSLEGPINFEDVDRFVFHTYHNKDFYRDIFNDTLYEHSTKKFIGPRTEYVHLQNGRDKYGNFLSNNELVNN